MACGDDDGAANGADGGAEMDAGSEADTGSGSDANAPADAGGETDAGFADARTDDAGGARGNVPGRHDHVLEVEGEMREVIVYVPELARGDVAAPVVLMLHGTSGDGARFFNISQWREKADEVGLIAVFPTALTYCFFDDENRDGDFTDPGEQKVTTKWNAGALDDRLPLCSAAEIAMLPPMRRALADHPLRDDVMYLDAVLDLLAEQYVVDRRRVYVSGFSNGAMMSSRLAAERSTRYAAAASAAGFLGIDAPPAERPIPVVLSAGSVDDGLVAAVGVRELPLDESSIALPALAAMLERYRALLQLRDVYTFEQQLVGGRRVARFTYAESTVGASNVLGFVVIEGLGHQYPNGTNHPVRIVDPLWEIFSAYSLP